LGLTGCVVDLSYFGGETSVTWGMVVAEGRALGRVFG